MKDPANESKPSVSLTIMCIVVGLTIAVGLLECFEIIKGTSLFLEMTAMFVALYFGRRVSFKGKLGTSVESSEAEKKKE